MSASKSLLIAVGLLVFIGSAIVVALERKSGRSLEERETVVQHDKGSALVAEQPLSELVRASDAVAIGTVASISEPRMASRDEEWFDDALIYRDVTIDVQQFLHREAGFSSPLSLRVVGGKLRIPPHIRAKKGLPDDAVRVSEGEAHFETGERVLVLVRHGILGFKEDSTHESQMQRTALTGAWQGKFRVVDDKAVNDVIPNRSTTISEIARLIADAKGPRNP